MELVFLIIVLLFIIWRIYVIFVGKGKIGELVASAVLARLPKEDFAVYNNVLINTDEEGHTSQIDHLVISIYGIFVIETKNYSGYIYGSENAEYWRQYFKWESYEMRNPVKQNQSHVYALQNLLKEHKPLFFYPIVVFVGDAVLRIWKREQCICYVKDLYDEICSHTVRHYTHAKMNEFCDIIELVDQSDERNDQEHTQQVKWLKIQAESDRRNLICPKCGKPLVERYGRFGRFYGCKGYPNCTYTSNCN